MKAHILPVIQQFMQEHPDVTTYMQDGSRMHTSGVRKDALNSCGWACMDHPANSPNPNPIEPIWRLRESLY
jgi:hypothetical protein